MHTEHLQNVRPGWVTGGWLVAIAVTSFVVFTFMLVGLMGQELPRDTIWAMVAVAVGFMIGGWFTGFGTVAAPILHGVALGLMSLVVWAGLNLAMAVAFRGFQWEGLTAGITIAVIVTQIAAAVVGCWFGSQAARRKAERLSESPEVGVRDRGGPAD